MPDTNQDIEVLANWEEPKVASSGWASGKQQRYIWLVLGLIFIIAIIIGFFTKDSNYYLGAGVIAAGAFAIFSQLRHPAPQLSIIVAKAGVEVGKKIYAIDDIAGFWLGHSGEYPVINLELKKRTPFPVTFLYPGPNREEARDLFLEILPELEPRQETVADSLSRFIRL